MMFREMRRKSRQISDEDAVRLLQNERRGVLAVNGDDGYPFAFPINYFYDARENAVYFHGAKSGYKVDALKRCGKVCFTVYGNERRNEGDWAPFVQSVVCFGRCTLIEESPDTEERVRTLALKYYPGPEEVEEEIRKDIKAVQLYKIKIEHLTGKQIHEK